MEAIRGNLGLNDNRQQFDTFIIVDYIFIDEHLLTYISIFAVYRFLADVTLSPPSVIGEA